MKKVGKIFAIALCICIWFSVCIFTGIGISAVCEKNPENSIQVVEPTKGTIIETAPTQETLLFADEQTTFQYFLDKEKYYSLTQEQIEQKLNDICLIVSVKYLNFDRSDVDKVELYFEKDDCYGFHSGNYIKINLQNISKAKVENEQILKTLFHEIKHDAQELQVKRGYETALVNSLNNYISDGEEYYNQLVEQDARAFADYMLNLVKNSYAQK